MSLLDGTWKANLPTLEAIDADIEAVNAELARLRELREGVRLILSATGELDRVCNRDLQGLSAKDRIIQVLTEAGGPVKWTELQARVSQGPNPPTPGTIASAYYHNTKAGSQSFVPLPGGYAGLAGRDEGWEPTGTPDPQQLVAGGTLRDLVRTFIATHGEFTLQELQGAVLAQRPGALAHTIRGHLSHAGTQGWAEKLGGGRWRSLTYPGTDAAPSPELFVDATEPDEGSA